MSYFAIPLTGGYIFLFFRGVDILKNDVKAIIDQISNSSSIETKEDTPPMVIPLRTALKIIPGKKLAIYIGVVITLLMLMYNLSIDKTFILKCDKDWIDLFFSIQT